jgi:hypothetical protein
MSDHWPCTEDPELWFSTNGDDRAEAMHVCLSHCPILQRCREWAEAEPPVVAVQAGVVWTWDRTPDRRRHPVAHRCRRCPALPISGPNAARIELARQQNQQPDTFLHGESAGYYRHLRSGDRACDPCRLARNAQKRKQAS